MSNVRYVHSIDADFKDRTPENGFSFVHLLGGDGRPGLGITDAARKLYAIGLCPSAIGLDLYTLAVLVYAIDTRINRRTGEDGWSRSISLRVPVGDLALWTEQKATIERLLNFLTGDIWSISFFQRTSTWKKLLRIRRPRRAVKKMTEICLLSGGLDSCIGAIDFLSRGSSPLFLGQVSDNATSECQKDVYTFLQKSYPGADWEYLRMPNRIPKTLFEGAGSESTQRSRSFLFFAIAALAGSAFNRPVEIIVPENGFISLNVPLGPMRLGSLSTRTTHPYVLETWNKLLTSLGIQATMHNPYQYKTKGEMMLDCVDQKALQDIASKTISCSSPLKSRFKGVKMQQCGYCVPCIIRRAAFNRSGIDDTTSYTAADLSAVLPSNKALGAHFRAFKTMALRLSAVPNLERALVLQPGPLSGGVKLRSAYADLYKRGLIEANEIAKQVLTRPI